MSFSVDNYKNRAKSKQHSKEYIKDVVKYTKKLLDKNLPVIFSITHLANCLQIKPTELLKIAEYGNFFDIAHKSIILNLSQPKSVKNRWYKSIRLSLNELWKKCISLLNSYKIQRENDFFDNLTDEFSPIAPVSNNQEEFYYDDINEYNVINSNYKFFALKKKSGGTREIMAPKGQLKNIQRWINFYILNKIRLHDNCFGFIKGKSIKDNAMIHASQECILNIDLLKFFDTITQERVFGMFKEFGYHPNLARLLANLTTAKHKEWYWKDIDLKEHPELKALVDKKPKIIPQGAPTSPAISNIISRKLDNRLNKLASKCNCKYSRYADDITFSGVKSNIPSLKLISKIINEEGFYINKKKVGYYSKGSKQHVTGLSINYGVRIPRERKRLIRQTLHYCKMYGVENHRKITYSDNKKHFKEWLAGNIAFIQSVEPDKANEYWEMFNNIEWETDILK